MFSFVWSVNFRESLICIDVGKYYDQRVVCLSVCLSARMAQNHTFKFHKHFLYMLPVAVARPSSEGNVVPVLWMASCFHITNRIGPMSESKTTSMLRTVRHVAAPGPATVNPTTDWGEVCISDCILFLRCRLGLEAWISCSTQVKSTLFREPKGVLHGNRWTRCITMCGGPLRVDSVR